jgi:2-C-methyl-D-erythritol 2,4-cyclodiphosphate synthase
MCNVKGIKDSREYLKEALKYLADLKICHVSLSIECKTPKITPRIPEMKRSIASLLGISEGAVGITATTGEGLTDFGRGLGIQVLCIVTVC